MAYTDKSELRVLQIKKRLALQSGQKKKYDATIVEKAIIALELIKPHVIHIFKTLNRNGEVDTSGLFEWALDHGIAVYSTIEINGKWQIVRFETIKRFWPEKPASVDVIVVPLLAFDTDLHRLGYGGAYYDKLSDEYAKSRLIGLAYEIQRIEKLPIETHDKALDSVITEVDVYTKNH